MKFVDGTCYLEEVRGYTPYDHGVRYTDKSGNEIYIPMKLLIQLYEGAKFQKERYGIDWKEFTDRFFENDNKEN